MASLTTKTVEKIVRTAVPGLTNDGDGLYLKIGRTGKASWIFRFKLAGKSRDMGLGRATEVSLAAARENAAETRRLCRRGIDPLQHRVDELERERLKNEREQQAVEVAKANATTFKEMAVEYISIHKSGWKNPKHAQQWESTLVTYAFKVIGNLPTHQVGVEHILKILTPIWAKKPETANRLRNRIELVLDAAKAKGLRDGENPARWRGHLDKLLPPRKKIRGIKHHAVVVN